MNYTGNYVKINIPDIESFRFNDKIIFDRKRKKNGSPWKNLPRCSGVYFFTDKEEIFYVGESDNINKRIRSHNVIDESVNRIYYLPVTDICERKLLELIYIMVLKPRLNKITYR